MKLPLLVSPHLLFFTFLFYSVQAQNLPIAAGGDGSGPGGSLSFAIGQVAYDFQTDGSFSLSGGTQQPFEVSIFPIELLYFQASVQGAFVELSWATATELNNDYFTLEKSLNGNLWEHMERVPGAGNSQEVNRYRYLDKTPFMGISYYRLKQTDLDGTFSYSDIVSAYVNESGITMYPNPVTDVLNLLVGSTNYPLLIKVHDVQGRLMSSTTLHTPGDLIDVSKLADGLYSVSAFSAHTRIFSQRILKYQGR